MRREIIYTMIYLVARSAAWLSDIHISWGTLSAVVGGCILGSRDGGDPVLEGRIPDFTFCELPRKPAASTKMACGEPCSRTCFCHGWLLTDGVGLCVRVIDPVVSRLRLCGAERVRDGTVIREREDRCTSLALAIRISDFAYLCLLPSLFQMRNLTPRFINLESANARDSRHKFPKPSPGAVGPTPCFLHCLVGLTGQADRLRRLRLRAQKRSALLTCHFHRQSLDGILQTFGATPDGGFICSC